MKNNPKNINAISFLNTLMMSLQLAKCYYFTVLEKPITWLKSVHIQLTPNSLFINHNKLEWLAPTKHPFMNFEEILIKRTFTFILYKQNTYPCILTQPDSSNSCIMITTFNKFGYTFYWVHSTPGYTRQE